MPVRRELSLMAATPARSTRKQHRTSPSKSTPSLVSAPFAVTSDGDVVLSVDQLDGISDLSSAMRAIEHQDDVFIGVVLTSSEVKELKERLGHGMREAAASLAYCRQTQS